MKLPKNLIKIKNKLEKKSNFAKSAEFVAIFSIFFSWFFVHFSSLKKYFWKYSWKRKKPVHFINFVMSSKKNFFFANLGNLYKINQLFAILIFFVHFYLVQTSWGHFLLPIKTFGSSILSLLQSFRTIQQNQHMEKIDDFQFNFFLQKSIFKNHSSFFVFVFL